jgi:hypothetical protein
LSELQKTELPTAEKLQLERMKELAEQKLIAEGPLVIAQRDFEASLALVGDPVEYVKLEELRRMEEKITGINEKKRIQPFLQSFWDEINQNIFELEQLKSFKLPDCVVMPNGKSVLESNGGAKASFFKLINNLFVGNGTITRALNPSGDSSIPSPQAQIKDFYRQLCAKYIPESILDENGNTINLDKVNNPELNVPKEYLKILSDLLEKLRLKYEIEKEKNKKQSSLILNIRKERTQINGKLDTELSTLVQKEIDKIIIVQNALKNSIRENQFRLR